MPLIHACARTIRQCAANLPDAISLHSCIAAAGFGTDPDLGALLIQLYGKCGSVDRARSLFESLPRKSALCWNFVIGAYAGNGRGEESLYLFRRMALEGERPDRHTFVRVLGACTNTAQGTAIHRHISSSGLEFDLMLQNSLVALYGRYGRVDLARSVFQSIPEKSLVSWNAMLTAYARNGHSREAAHAYNEMIFTGIEPNEISFSSVLGSCDDLELGRSIHARTLAEFPAIFFEAMAQTSIVSFYSRLGRVEIARAFLEETKVASVAPWNAMISGYAQHGLVREALGAYHSIDLEGLEPNHRTLTTVLGACSSSKDLKTGKMIHSRAVCCGFDKEDQALQVAVVNFYGKCGAVADARRVFDGIAQKSVVVHTAMIGGYAQHGHSLEALEIYHAMNLEGVTPDSTTFVCALVACNHAGLLQRGKLLFQILVSDHSSRPSLEHFLCMADLLGRAGRVDFAREVVEGMPFEADAVAWKALLGSSRGSIDLEKAAFAAQRLVEMDEELGQAFVLLSNAFSSDSHVL
ncbi:hypothetical protein SELMODRAFT_89343 [Selaginella moellendorffii]|uniref:Pentacotripeptide-repeat region of PRORP domain-containing protein n=1 Tax=Selaginella moellendorffii TaxID=88036 RepID=D8RBI7_SELML|nr:hypothetical protein SELMODRAFT_89343 [Selaginella moellendorffii]